jgi:hypothetical protein
MESETRFGDKSQPNPKNGLYKNDGWGYVIGQSKSYNVKYTKKITNWSGVQ